MILEDLGFSACITNSEGDQLPEFEVKRQDNNTIECWIPSAEGTNFEVRDSASKGTQPKLGLKCKLYLDGQMMGGGIMKSAKVARGKIGSTSSHAVSSSTARLYQFGRRKLTDRDDGLRPNKFVQEHLNTIRIELMRGRCGRRTEMVTFTTPKGDKPIHEQAAKNGHAGSAELGEVVPISVPYTRKFSPEPSIEPEWLKAREIIPCSPEPEILELGPQVGQKHPRDATPEAIDVDEVETDDDDVVIVKHMIPAPNPSKQKQRRFQAQVKEEEEVEEPDLEVEENEDMKPKQEPDSGEMAPATSKSKRRKVKSEKDIGLKRENIS